MANRSAVPCAGCTACCRGELVSLHPEDGDDVASYEHELMRCGPGEFVPVLRRQKNGDCIYLIAGGCSIHARAPVMCRIFDCRQVYLRHQARSPRWLMPGEREILEAGRARLGSL